MVMTGPESARTPPSMSERALLSLQARLMESGIVLRRGCYLQRLSDDSTDAEGTHEKVVAVRIGSDAVTSSDYSDNELVRTVAREIR
jgi:hypothetical protein